MRVLLAPLRSLLLLLASVFQRPLLLLPVLLQRLGLVRLYWQRYLALLPESPVTTALPLLPSLLPCRHVDGILRHNYLFPLTRVCGVNLNPK